MERLPQIVHNSVAAVVHCAQTHTPGAAASIDDCRLRWVKAAKHLKLSESGSWGQHETRGHFFVPQGDKTVFLRLNSGFGEKQDVSILS